MADIVVLANIDALTSQRTKRFSMNTPFAVLEEETRKILMTTSKMSSVHFKRLVDHRFGCEGSAPVYSIYLEDEKNLSK